MPAIARGGHSWLFTCLAILIGLAYGAWRLGHTLAWIVLGIAAALWLLLAWFFRDPERVIAPGLVSPADGRVIAIEPMHDDDVGDAERISIFMSPLDVHVNRFPVTGAITRMQHHAGKHIPAFNKDSERNERVETIMEHAGGTIKVVQITGAVARRIVPYHQPGSRHDVGDRMGLIRLGSRADVYVPRGAIEWTVAPGQKIQAGATSLGQWRRT